MDRSYNDPYCEIYQYKFSVIEKRVVHICIMLIAFKIAAPEDSRTFDDEFPVR